MSGTPGSGKSSVAAHFAQAACQRGERCLFFLFEESPGQVTRNMRSIGLDLERWLKKGMLRFHATRASVYGLEMHLATLYKLVQQFQPSAVIVDPINNLSLAGTRRDTTAMLTRMIDFLKLQGITALLTSMTSSDQNQETTDTGISSLVDTWLLLRDIELSGERNRAAYVLKSRGMSHSNQIREFLLTDRGIELVDIYLETEGVLTGSARKSQDARERASGLRRQQKIEAKQRGLAQKRAVTTACSPGKR